MNLQQPSTANSPVIVWFRRDLRTSDHAALSAAAATGHPVLPVFVLESGESDNGSASRWWLHHSLVSLRKELAVLGLPLVLLRGGALEVLLGLCARSGASEVHAHHQYEPSDAEREEKFSSALSMQGIQMHFHPGTLLSEPTDLRTGKGGPFQVFTPYWKAFANKVRTQEPLPSLDRVRSFEARDIGVSLESLKLLPSIGWDGGLRAAWNPGASGAAKNLQRFLAGPVEHYDSQRDLPHVQGTSQLSAHLHFGEISPRQIWHAAKATGPTAAPFLRQLVWREFAHHLLHHFPHTTDKPLRPQFEDFPWDGDPSLLSTWQKGETGYPLVDAGMRQLWTTGWMHNRVRMVAASFLVKHLLLPWQEGAAWFRDTLVDADLANNTFGWQWTAGCGADAAPYFRVFNPTLQGKKFDPEGAYIRRWIPELQNLSKRWIHEPSSAPALELATAGVTLGRDYPHPVIDHAVARERALDCYRRMRMNNQ